MTPDTVAGAWPAPQGAEGREPREKCGHRPARATCARIERLDVPRSRSRRSSAPTHRDFPVVGGCLPAATFNWARGIAATIAEPAGSAALAGIAFPYAAQAVQIVRRTRPVNARTGKAGRWRTETVYAITDLAPHQASSAELAGWVRGHWQIENALH